MEEIGDDLSKVDVPMDNSPAVPPAPAPKPPFWPSFFHQFMPLIIIMLGVTVLVLVVVSYYAYPKLTGKNSNPPPTALKPTPTTNPTAQWQIYNNSQEGYIIKYPEGFTLNNDNPGEIEILYPVLTPTPSQPFEGLTSSIISVGTTPNSNSETLDRVANEQLGSDYKNLKSEPIEIGGVAGRFYPSVLGQTESQYAFIINNGHLYTFILGVDQAHETIPSTKNTFKQILSTFKFTPPTGGSNSSADKSCSQDSDCALTNYDPCPNTKCNNYAGSDWVSVNANSLTASLTPTACTLIYPVCARTLEQSNAQYSAKCVNSVCQKVKN